MFEKSIVSMNKYRLPNTAKGPMTNSTQTPLSVCTSDKGSCGCTYAVNGRQQSPVKTGEDEERKV